MTKTENLQFHKPVDVHFTITLAMVLKLFEICDICGDW